MRHPERVSGLVLYGAYAKGYSRRGDPAAEQEYQAIIELARIGWGRDNPVFRQVFTSRFIPDGKRGADGLVQRAVPEDDVTRTSPRSC